MCLGCARPGKPGRPALVRLHRLPQFLSGFLAKLRTGTTNSALSLLWHLCQKWQQLIAWLFPGAVRRALGLVPAPQREETSPVSGFSAHSTHRHASQRHLPAQALENAAHGRPTTLTVLFLLSLVRQGCIKRVFALLDAQNNSSFAQGVQQKTVTSLAPTPVLELLQSLLVSCLPRSCAGRASVCFPGCVPGRLAAPGWARTS